MTPFETFALRLLYAVLTAFLAGTGVLVANSAGLPLGKSTDVPKAEVKISPASSSIDTGRLQKAPDAGASPLWTPPDLGGDVFHNSVGLGLVLKPKSRG